MEFASFSLSWSQSQIANNQGYLARPYSGKVLREKTFANWWIFAVLPKDATPPNFTEKTFSPLKVSSYMIHLTRNVRYLVARIIQ